MSVVAFERRQGTGEWSETELSTIVAALHAAIASGRAVDGKPAARKMAMRNFIC